MWPICPHRVCIAKTLPCLRAAKNGAVVKRPDGIVLIDPQKARGQKALVQACPYGAIWWNEEKQIPQKCTFCAHLLDAGWKAPRCVQACPTGALSVASLLEEEEMKRTDQTVRDWQNLEWQWQSATRTPTSTTATCTGFKNALLPVPWPSAMPSIPTVWPGATVNLYQNGRLFV